MVTRRTLLKAGLVGGALLAVGGGAALLAGRDPAADRATVLRAVVPAILAGALPESGEARREAIGRAVEGVGTAIAGLSPAAQKEIGQLFSLLALAPGRLALAGVSSPWDEASVEQVSAFLQDWRTHRLALMQSGYHALHDLVFGAWYGDERSWAAIGYGGPLRM